MRNTVVTWLTPLLILSACTTPAADPAQAAAPDLPPACLTGALTATITRQTPTTAELALTNRTPEACSVGGWPTLTLVSAARRVVPVSTTKLDKPAQSQTFELPAGASAYAALEWTACKRTSATCRVGANLRYSLSLTTDGPTATLKNFPTPRRTRLAMSALWVGVLVPHRG